MGETDDTQCQTMRMKEKETLWINTPHGMIYIRVGYGGIQRIVSWTPHEIKVKKATTRGELQVTHIEPDFDSVYAWKKQVEAE